jgi:hypothetical protein
VLCLQFLEKVLASEPSQETVDKVYVELHLLMNTSVLKREAETPRKNSQELNRSAEYEVVTTDTSQDSMMEWWSNSEAN